ncbi:MAG: hypothetical protein JNK82_27730 [Myxococcaceae bacterium]|nr:hypothetical protein [Myxococcaceae bacterium]
MCAPLVVGVVLLASSPPITLAAPGLNAINLDVKVVQFYGDHVAQQLVAAHVDVKTSKDIATLLGMERQRQLLGCDTGQGSCIAELAGALGADGLLLGDIGKIAGTYQVNLKVMSQGGELLASYSARTQDEEAVLGLLTRGAHTLARDLYPKLGRGEAPAPAEATVVARGGAVRRYFWVPAAGAVALLAAGVVLQVLAENEWGRLSPQAGSSLSLSEASRAASNGKSYQLWSGVLFGGGLALALAAAGMFVFGGESATVTALVVPDGAGVAVGGALP